ncbi:MAG: hypothetical protein AB2A00_20415 [Myxococcota bacterium]
MKTRWWWLAGLLMAYSCQGCPCTEQPTCELDSDCGTDQACVNGECQARGTACLVDDECPPDQACQDGFCRTGVRNARTDAGPPDAGLECSFQESRCLNDSTVETCEFGRYSQVDCARNGLSCQEGGCHPPPCNPDAGAARCLDLHTLESCVPPVGERTDCAGNETCWQGRCAKSTGEPCTTDDECAGGYCHCKPGECPGTGLENGYCSMRNCNVDGGSPCPATDVCMGLASAGGGRINLCGARADNTCPESTRGQDPAYPGPFKRRFPVPDPANPEQYTFDDEVCFEKMPLPVGAGCAGPTECIGGASVGFISQCVTFSGTVVGGYCTHACDATHPCPPEAACAHFQSDPAGAGICLLKCGEQRQGLAQCNREGLSCKQPGGAFTILDSSTDVMGFCVN